MLTHRLGVQGTDTIWCRPSMITVANQSDNQLGVTEDGHVCVVRADDDLSLSFQFAQTQHNSVVDETIVQIILWLINDQWAGRRSEQ